MFIPTYLFLKADDNHEDKINVQKVYSLKLERKPRVLIVANRIESNAFHTPPSCFQAEKRKVKGRRERFEMMRRSDIYVKCII